MPFTVGQYLTKNDLKSQEDAHTLGYGVVNGLKVVPTDPVSMDIQVETGKAYAADTLVEKGAVTDLTVAAADPTNPRKDIVVCDSAGTLSIVAGTPEAALPSGNVGIYTLNPEPESIPANSIILAEIWVTAGATEITGSEIYDKRVSIADFLTHKDAATGVHGVGAGKVCSETECEAKIAAKLKAGTVTETTGADGKISVTFAEAFASTPVVKVQLEGDVDYYPVVTAKSTTGFTVKILKTAHAHSQGNTGAEAAHTHGISFASGGGSAHHHTVPDTSSTGSHRHSHNLTSGAGGAHSHTQGVTGVPSATVAATGAFGSAAPRYCATTSGGSPTYQFVAMTTTPSLVSAGKGTHTHTNPNTSTKASHTHGITGYSAYAGTHSHTIGNTGDESSHTHSVSGTSGAGSSHSHSNPDTAQVNAGNLLANTEVTFSYIAMLP